MSTYTHYDAGTAREFYVTHRFCEMCDTHIGVCTIEKYLPLSQSFAAPVGAAACAASNDCFFTSFRARARGLVVLERRGVKELGRAR